MFCCCAGAFDSSWSIKHYLLTVVEGCNGYFSDEYGPLIFYLPLSFKKPSYMLVKNNVIINVIISNINDIAIIYIYFWIKFNQVYSPYLNG